MGAAAAVAAVGVGAGLAGSVMQSQATSSAAGKSIAAQQEAEARARADLQPWVGTGGQANTQTANLLGLNGPDAATAAMGNYQTSPGYQWQLGEGLRAVDAGAAGKGMLRSGATLKAEQTYGAGLADQDFSQYYDRLAKMSGVGQASAAGQAADSMATGKGVAATDMTLGQQQASIYGNVASGIGNAANSYMNNKLYADRTASIYGNNSMAGGTTPTTYIMPPGGYSGYYGEGGGTPA